VIQLLARKSAKYYFGKKSAILYFYISPHHYCADLNVHMKKSDEGQQLPAQERLPAMTKKMAQPGKLSAKAAKEICRKFSIPVCRPSGQKQQQKLDS
jgi:hypothetical protein